LKIGRFKVSKRAVSPVIATLLMIAVAVAASVIVYVWSAGLLGTLMGGGGAQVKEQLILEAYNWKDATAGLTVFLRNVGSSDIEVAAIYVGGTAATSGATGYLSVKQSTSFTPTVPAGITAGTAYVVKVVTKTGGVFSFSCIAGTAG